MAFVAGALAILAAAFVKGAVAFGFPLVATPLLALAVGVKTAVAVSILPNIAMDSVTLVLGVFVLLFVAVSASGFALRVSADWEPWLSPPVGLAAGVLGGLTNVPGTPMVLYFVALGMEKYEFVRAVAVTFIVVKVVQLVAVAWYGLL